MTNNGNRNFVVGESSRGKFKIDDVPPNHMKKFYLNSDSLGSQMQYLMLLTWIRTKCCMDGTMYDGIPNVNHCTSHPYIQIEIIHGELHNKFLISKKDLYLVAFTNDGKWYAFDDKSSVKIEGVTHLTKSVTYKTQPWMEVGPKELSKAMRMLKNNNVDVAVQGCEIVMIHLCEAARFTPLQHLIARALNPDRNSDEHFDVVGDEKELVDLVDEQGKTLDDRSDIYTSIKPKYSVNFKISLTTSDQIREFIHNWETLSKIWYKYSLSDRQNFDVMPGDLRKFGIRNIRSLRSILAVLCNYNARKNKSKNTVPDLKSKSKQNG